MTELFRFNNTDELNAALKSAEELAWDVQVEWQWEEFMGEAKLDAWENKN